VSFIKLNIWDNNKLKNFLSIGKIKKETYRGQHTDTPVLKEDVHVYQQGFRVSLLEELELLGES
jgi:hypothetical protein